MPKKIPPHINTYCTYCKAIGHDKVKAVWRISYDTSKRACEAHRELLVEYERKMNKLDRQEMSEGDYQSWGRL